MNASAMREITVLFDTEPISITEIIGDCAGCVRCCVDYIVPLTPAECRRLPVSDMGISGGHFLAKKDDGSCVMLTECGTCAIWDERPICCREYSCKRINPVSKIQGKNTK